MKCQDRTGCLCGNEKVRKHLNNVCSGQSHNPQYSTAASKITHFEIFIFFLLKMQQEVCSALMQHMGNKCPEVSCNNPLKPIGHCCGVCGRWFYKILIEHITGNGSFHRVQWFYTFVYTHTYLCIVGSNTLLSQCLQKRWSNLSVKSKIFPSLSPETQWFHHYVAVFPPKQ